MCGVGLFVVEAEAMVLGSRFRVRLRRNSTLGMEETQSTRTMANRHPARLGEVASSTQHHRGHGPTSSLGHVSIGRAESRKQIAVRGGSLIVEVQAAVCLKSGSWREIKGGSVGLGHRHIVRDGPSTLGWLLA